MNDGQLQNYTSFKKHEEPLTKITEKKIISRRDDKMEVRAESIPQLSTTTVTAATAWSSTASTPELQVPTHLLIRNTFFF